MVLWSVSKKLFGVSLNSISSISSNRWVQETCNAALSSCFRYCSVSLGFHSIGFAILALGRVEPRPSQPHCKWTLHFSTWSKINWLLLFIFLYCSVPPCQLNSAFLKHSISCTHCPASGLIRVASALAGNGNLATLKWVSLAFPFPELGYTPLYLASSRTWRVSFTPSSPCAWLLYMNNQLFDNNQLFHHHQCFDMIFDNSPWIPLMPLFSLRGNAFNDDAFVALGVSLKTNAGLLYLM